MKVSLLPLVLFIALLTVSRAIDIVTPTEKYFDAKVTRVEADGVRIAHREGAAVIDFDDLPAAMQLEYGWTPEKSAARKAARAAEAKKITDEERMIEDAPKRKAEEAAAKERVIQEEGAEAAARARVDAMEAQKDLLAEAAKARAEIDRDRAGGKAPPKAEAEIPTIPVAEVIVEPESRARTVITPVGSVAALLEEEKPSGLSRNIMIGLGVASAVVLLLFLLPASKTKVRVVTGAAGKRR